ncbi:phage tail tape measure protein [Vogesella sp. GCM10023246]|uniref:Phage tail tape measure protein n=1 Tax=Vogesella oryzagri TaxID=3160864 RepID=A0ABV1M5D7_9NEIS
MSKDVAIGIVIGGAVSATLGAAVGKTQKSVEGLQKGIADTKGIKSLIGETQRLQRELAEADKAGRRIGLESVRQLRGELGGLEKDWQASTTRVGELAKSLNAAKQAAAGQAAAVPALEAEHRALSESARLAAAHADIKRAAWQDGKNNAAMTRQQVQALKGEADAARGASQQAKSLATAKKAQIDAAKAATLEEARLTSALGKAQRAAAAAKTAFEDKRVALQAARSELRNAGTAVGDTTRQTVKLGDAARQAAQGQQQLANVPLRDKLAANTAKLRDMGVEVGNLDKAMRKLQQTEKGMQWQQAGAAKMQSGIELGKTAGVAAIGAAAVPTKISGDFQAEVRDIAIKAGVANKAGEKELVSSIMQIAAAQKMDRTALAQSINGLVTQGMDVKEATGHGELLAELIRGQKMAPEDAAKLIYSFGQNGVSQKDMRKTMGEVAVAGDLGAFESDKMAKFMPELLATTGALGFQGPDAVRYIAASLQAQVKLTGDPDSAANNFKNLLAKITAPDTDKKFKDGGVNLQESMKAYMKAGYNPVEAFIALTEKLTAKQDPKQAKKLEDLKAKIKNSGGNKQQENEALDAYLKMAGLAEILTDQQARSGALAQIKYGGQIKSDLSKIQRTDGGKKLSSDKALRDDTSNSRWEAVAADFSASMIAVGDAIRPVTNLAAGFASSLLQLGTGFAQAHPEAAMLGVAAGAVTLGVAAKRIVGGAVQWGAGKVLTTLGGKVGAATAGKGGLPGALSDVLGGGKPGAGVQQVFVTNMPSGGLPDLGGGGSKPPGKLTQIGASVRGALGGVATAGRAALAAPSLGAVAAGGTATVATAVGMTAAAGVAGYGIGTAINAGITAGLTASNGGKERTLGTWLFDKLQGDADAKALAPTIIKRKVAVGSTAVPVPTPSAPSAKVTPPTVVPQPAKAATAKPAPPPVVQHFTFSPKIDVKVLGDAKNPAEIAAQLAPHLKRLFDQWSAKARTSGGGMYDPVGG